jgi:5'-AMP-activated protein kinase regulatory beta subunit
MDAATAAFIASCKEKEGATKKLPTIFKYNGNAKDVYVCGTFNNWQKLKMSRSTKDFVAIVDLKEGEHEYKFLVDGEWVNDPNEPKKDAKDEHGFLVTNNLIRVQKEDFDAYHALDMDSKAVALAQQSHKKRLFADTFNQEIPQYVTERTEHRTGPPILPPHLLQVILNKDTPLSCEPTLLPEPNHVMLNHLYALSIKDGVMVLSSTQRYRRKYVTTLLYKPMGVRKNQV